MISVIIPVYNHAKVLQKSIDSVLNQTYKDIEIIIVNDGSTDNFSEVIKNSFFFYKEGVGGGSIKIINQKNLGAPVARNNGFKESNGGYVIFWDADTIAKPKMLEKMINTLKNNPQASFAYSGFKFGLKTFKSFEYNPEKLKKFNYIDTTSLIRRSDFCEFDENLKKFQDWDLWLSMLEKNKTGIYIPEILYKKIVRGRKGISLWKPKMFYKIFKNKDFEEAKQIILKKHHLN